MTNTQNQRLIAYLEKHGHITQLEALTELGIFRLASRINDIKRMGTPSRVIWSRLIIASERK